MKCCICYIENATLALDFDDVEISMPVCGGCLLTAYTQVRGEEE
jgi:hypothetical protein